MRNYFIKVTRIGYDDATTQVYLNVNNIVSIGKAYNAANALIDMTDGSCREVAETPEDLLRKIDAAQ